MGPGGLVLFDLLEESKNLIAMRSDATAGTRELVEHLVPFCKRVGFHLKLQMAGNGQGEQNLIAHTVPPGSTDLCPGGLLLATHLDTVPAGDRSLWTETGGDPFRPTLKGDKLFGLGSADTKLDFLCKLQAIEEVGLRKIKIPLALVGTFGEERALAGARLIQESGIMHPRWALVGEPSDLEPVIAHKGILYLRAGGTFPVGRSRGVAETKEFRGRAAHGSMPHLGENAIERAVGWLTDEVSRRPALQLLKIDGGTVHNIVPERCTVEVASGDRPCPRIAYLRKFFDLIEASRQYLATHRNGDFNPPQTTFNVGVIRSPAPDRFEIEFDFRLIPETDGNQLYEIFRQLPGVAVIRSNPPMKTDRKSEIARRVGEALTAVGLPIRYRSKSGNTEGTIFNSMGAESIVIGPGRSAGNIHAPNEYNEIPQLKKAVEFYTAFLRQWT